MRADRVRARGAIIGATLGCWYAATLGTPQGWMNPGPALRPTRRDILAAAAASLAYTPLQAWASSAALPTSLQDIAWSEPKRRKTDLNTLADDFARAFQREQWGVNGRVLPRFFTDDFKFRDPDVSTTGLQEYAKGVAMILSGCTADVVDVQLLEQESAFVIRWRIAGTVNVPVPGIKIKPYIVSSTFGVNSGAGLVESEVDTFSVPTWDILLSAIFPDLPFLAPPEPPPIQSKYACW
mmetsp:Transcript_62063/g.115159  ORF Transcript_62063/g.115159 Transcript_62063/m.115159 type:complete len:238 (-) Transcript_62063:1-714(-)